MAHIILGWDGTDAEAPARRAAIRPQHLPVITRMAAEGRLHLAVPLADPSGVMRGSLMLLAEADELATREYLLEEPFARDGVWLSYQMRPFRLADLPFQPLPTGPTPDRFTHTVTIAEDAPGAPRSAARQAHMARMQMAAADGTLAMGGALLDAGGAMVGSIAVTRHATLPEAEAWWAADAYVTQGVWGATQRFLTRFAPLPYAPLPRAAAA